MLKQKGQSIVELTLITPLMLLALYVPFDFGMALYTASLAQNAVRDVARKASTKDGAAFNAGTLQTEIVNRMPSMAISPVATVIKSTSGPANCMQWVQASVTYTYSFAWYKFARLFSSAVPDSASVTRTTQMRLEFQPDSNGGTGPIVVVCTGA